MLWREQQHFATTTSTDNVECSVAERGVLGCNLLNPMWTKVETSVTAALLQELSTCSSTAHSHLQQQQQPVTLYHAPSHGLISIQPPAAYRGPPGGLLCDEMGELE